jgi:hypothetical protein
MRGRAHAPKPTSRSHSWGYFRIPRRRVLLAVVGFVVGVVLLMTGLDAQDDAVSVVGILAQLVSVYFAVTSYRAVTTSAQLGVVEGDAVRKPRSAPRKARGAGTNGQGLMQRLVERCNRRRVDHGRGDRLSPLSPSAGLSPGGRLRMFTAEPLAHDHRGTTRA